MHYLMKSKIWVFSLQATTRGLYVWALILSKLMYKVLYGDIWNQQLLTFQSSVLTVIHSYFYYFIVGGTLLTLHPCVATFLLDQTLLRSLHLPKNNSLYVLTPDIAPSASTSKNRYLELSYFLLMTHPPHSPSPLPLLTE